MNAPEEPVNREEGDERIARVERVEHAPAGARPSSDLVTREEPLEIQIGSAPIAVVMRTPGHDEELARGFLVTERVIDDPSQVLHVRHCTTAQTPDAEDNVIQIVMREDVEIDLARLRRNLYASSSCGICGKATIENALAVAPPLDDAGTVEVGTLLAMPARLREVQSVFSRTGGLHAAGLFSADGALLVAREDVGRHNAVDKVIGWAWMHRRSLAGHVLLVSGRVSYEIVQKALAARIPIVAAVSAPTSLAIELAASARLTLVAFLRDPTLSVYAGAERIRR